MSDNVVISTATTTASALCAADEVTDGTLGTVLVQYVKIMDATLNGTNKLTITPGGAVLIDGSAYTQPVSGVITGGGINEGNTANANPILIAGADGTNILRSMLTAYDGSLMIRHRDQIFSEILSELRKIRLGMSIFVNEELEDPDYDM